MIMLLVGAITATLGLGLALEPGNIPAYRQAIPGLLGLAMGAQAATARKIGLQDIITVVVTSTITGLAAQSRLAGGTGQGNSRRVAAVALILAGAAVGAGLLLWLGLGFGLMVAGSIVAAGAVVGHVYGRDV